MSQFIFLGTSMNTTKTVFVNLTNIYGLGMLNTQLLLKQVGIGFHCKFDILTTEQLLLLQKQVKANFLIKTDLKKQIFNNIQQAKHLKTYNGLRHVYKLPCHGQRTHTNARTAKKYSINYENI